MGIPIPDLDVTVRIIFKTCRTVWFSPHILPIPDDWPSNVQVTGDWYLEPSRDFTPSAELLQFLEEGGAPVVIGFSSSVERVPGADIADD